ncbi:hypothetical protein [Legionella rowbothamii]|uniref:hypothetical protein n=1 Tax=Legionella rowbothamii TaxID=96229 RepID=UPI0010541A16|nr:hypothetical protein [Legionella rowbothamii]
MENPQRYINDTISLIADSRDVALQIDFSTFDLALKELAEKENDLRQRNWPESIAHYIKWPVFPVLILSKPPAA